MSARRTRGKTNEQTNKQKKKGKKKENKKSFQSPKEALEFTFVVWQRDVKVTFAKGSESPVLSAAMSPLAWYMWARSWKRCGAASWQRKQQHQLHGNSAAHGQEGKSHQLLSSQDLTRGAVASAVSLKKHLRHSEVVQEI